MRGPPGHDARVTAGSQAGLERLGGGGPGEYDHNYVPGFHFESTRAGAAPGQYVVNVCRTCSNGPGHCDETARDDAGKGFSLRSPRR